MDRKASIVAIVPAAGRSARMGTLKQLLPINGRPMLVGVVEALLSAGAGEVIVLASAALQRELPVLPTGTRVVVNPDPDSEMIDSIRVGLDAAGACDGVLVCPSDAAGMTNEDVRRCIDAFAEDPMRIVIATHRGRRGHPIIFSSELADVVRSKECDGGLNQLARHCAHLVRLVECPSRGTIANVNTPEDYEPL